VRRKAEGYMRPIDLREWSTVEPRTIARAVWDATPPLRVTVEWGTKLTRGAGLMLLAAAVGGLHSVLFILVPPVRVALLLGILPPMAVISTMGLWLISTPDPQNTSWLRKRRWLVRASVVVALSYEVARLICMGLLWVSAAPESHVAMAYYLVAVLAMAGSVAGLWYLRELARAIKDRFLRVVFSVLMWLLLVLLSLGILGAAAGPGAQVRNVPEVLRPSDAVSPKWLHALLIATTVCALSVYVTFRLWRRLRRTLAAAREEAPPPLPNAGVPAGSSSDE